MEDFFSRDDEHQDSFEKFNRIKSTEKSRNKRILMIVVSILAVVAFTLAAVIAFTAFFVDPSSSTRDTSSKKIIDSSSKEPKGAEASFAGSKEDTVTVKPQSNILIIGIENVKDKKVARGLMLARLSVPDKNIQAINIPDRTYVNIVGLGLDQISQSYTIGVNVTRKTVQDLLHAQVDSYITVPYEDYEILISDNNFAAMIDKAVQTSLLEPEKNAYKKALAKVDSSKINIIPLPVKYISLNGEPYYETNTEELSNLLGSLWGIKVEVNNKPTRIIVLNGAGEPGLGKIVSDRLGQNGFLVVDVKNASNFNYKKTQIVAYKDEYMEKARMIQQILGVGETTFHAVSQDVAELAVIIGFDFKSLNSGLPIPGETTTTVTTQGGSPATTTTTLPKTTTTTIKRIR